MKSAQSVDVDWAVIHPDTLRDSGRLLEAKKDLVDRIEYVVHFPKVPFLSVACGAHSARIARIREVDKLVDPVHGGLGGLREHLAQCRDIAVNRLFGCLLQPKLRWRLHVCRACKR
jgi:hypothetical protein